MKVQESWYFPCIS